MSLDRKFRLVVILAISLLALLLMIALIFLADTGLSLLERLRDQSTSVNLLVFGGFLVFGLLALWLIWRVLRPSKSVDPAQPVRLSSQDLTEELVRAQDRGVDVANLSSELKALAVSKTQGVLRLALVGEISTGKSSLIKALLPSADVAISEVGGSTVQAAQYTWISEQGDQVIVTDLPGFNVVDPSETDVQSELAMAHAAIFVCQGDLTRPEFDALKLLSANAKPVVVALNKTDLYSASDADQIEGKLNGYVAELFHNDLVSVVRIRADIGDIDSIKRALQSLIQLDSAFLERLRDSSVFALVSQRLDTAKREHAKIEGQALVVKYTKRAIVGALAAVAPGTDILIQGYLGTNLVKELCDLHDAPVKDLDIKRFLEICEQHVGRTTPMILAIAGNGFKAFPGIGTLAGGLIHAAAYGLIFDSLGRSLLETLQTRGSLQTLQASALFKEKLSEDLEKRAQSIAKLALSEKDSDG